MTPSDFIDAIRRVVFESAISGTLSLIKKPPGRSPPVNLSALSKWFSGLSENDKKMVQNAITIAAHQATFGMLAVLDGARQIEDSQEKGTLELHYLNDNQQIYLNTPDSEPLHELFNQRGMPY